MDVATWVLSGSLNSATPLSVTSTATNVTGASLSSGPSVPSSGGFQNEYWSYGWPYPGDASGGVLNVNKYFTFGTTATTGHEILYRAIKFTTCTSGPQSWAVRTSIDNYAANIATGTNVAANTDVTAAISSLGQRSGTVTFRVYFFATSNEYHGFKGSPAGGQDLKVTGIVF